MLNQELSEQIRNKAIELGFEKCGIISISAMSGYLDRLQEREKHFPQTEPFLNQFADFAHPESSFPWARSIVVAVWNFGQYRTSDDLKGIVGRTFLTTGPDSPLEQAQILLENFFKDHSLQYTSHAGLGLTSSRYAAEKAGLGIIRKNNFFYTENGSSSYITTWLIDAETQWCGTHQLAQCPDSCDLCRQACPTGSLSQDYAMNPLICIACLTTFTGRDLPAEPNRKQIGSWIYGCDACQDACPFNKKGSSELKDLPGTETVAKMMNPKMILALDEQTWKTCLQPQFWYLKPDELWKLKVNALNYMLNNWKDEYADLIRQTAKNESGPVRKMADFVLENTIDSK
ncbi:MAG: 4Fe-4S double cluster binding domain-containing protein [Planctomycetia bacterium]|nr:4Fe-4S double cluster binding domain-containing protein [Planctomycetia bacterium]